MTEQALCEQKRSFISTNFVLLCSILVENKRLPCAPSKRVLTGYTGITSHRSDSSFFPIEKATYGAETGWDCSSVSTALNLHCVLSFWSVRSAARHAVVSLNVSGSVVVFGVTIATEVSLFTWAWHIQILNFFNCWYANPTAAVSDGILPVLYV